jgi:hypothetical protein
MTQLHVDGHLPPKSTSADTVKSAQFTFGTGQYPLGPSLTADSDNWVCDLLSLRSTEPVNTDTDVSLGTSVATLQKNAPLRKRWRSGDEPLAHSTLPHMQDHAEVASNLSSKNDQDVKRENLQLPYPPRAVHPYGKSPWINAHCQAHLDLLAHIPPEDRYYLYNMKQVFQFPQRSVSRALMVTFFESVFPLLPIVDRCQTA